MTNWSRLFGYFRPDLLKILAALLFMGLGTAASVLKPWPVGIIIDSILSGKPAPAWIPGVAGKSASHLLIVFGALVFALHALHGAFSALQNYFSIRAGLNALGRIRNQLFGRMQGLSLAFYNRANQGDLIYRATWDTYALQTIFQQGLFKFLGSLATVALMVVVMWRVNYRLTVIALCIFPPLLLAMHYFGRAMNKRSLAAHNADSKVASLVQQNITAIALIQSYTLERKEQEMFGRQVDESLDKRTSQHTVEVVYWFVIALLFGLGTAILTWWGAREILANRLTIGELVVFLAYAGQLYEPLNQLSHVGATVADARAGLQRIFQLLDARDQVEAPAKAEEFPATRDKPALSFHDIAFDYIPGRTVLRGINFEVLEGETVGIIGPSGSGKTTLLNLIPRFYDPGSGVIRLRGVDLNRLNLEELRRHIAYVFQESILLPGTIAENITAGCGDAGMEKIEAAARNANAHEFIKRLPDGYNTLVGESNLRLSTGEKQRIAIARAFLKDAPILLLDEPTSSLDTENEGAIMESLARLMANRTTLMAAHRFTTLKRLNKILVVENGTVCEFGAPEELLRTGGYYSKMAAQNERL